jgi:hypothetical protein
MVMSFIKGNTASVIFAGVCTVTFGFLPELTVLIPATTGTRLL